MPDPQKKEKKELWTENWWETRAQKTQARSYRLSFHDMSLQ